MPRFESLNRVVCGFVGDVRYVDLISGAGGVGGGVGQGWLGRRGFYYLSAASHLISDAAAVAAGGARARGEAAAAAKAASDLPPHSPLLLPAAPKMPEVVPWPRYDAQHHLGLGLGSSSGIGSGRRSRLHSALVAAARPPKTAACCRVAAADDRKRNLFWSKPQLDRDQDQGVS